MSSFLNGVWVGTGILTCVFAAADFHRDLSPEKIQQHHNLDTLSDARKMQSTSLMDDLEYGVIGLSVALGSAVSFLKERSPS